MNTHFFFLPSTKRQSPPFVPRSEDKYGNSIGQVTDEMVKEFKALVKLKREGTTEVAIEKGDANEVKASFVLHENGNFWRVKAKLPLHDFSSINDKLTKETLKGKGHFLK